MSADYIYIALLAASLGTYFCRAMGVISAGTLSTESPIFHWVKCVSIGVIVSVISRIVLFPSGTLEQTTSLSRIIATLSLVLIYFISKKNILLSVVSSAIILVLLNFYI
jgi:branched-subunit amino acid transport protein